MSEDVGYQAVLILILTAAGTAVLMVALAQLIGPRRHGPVKHGVYESGMPPVGDARGRFHARFYVVALLFLLFDVELMLLWPLAPLFHDAAAASPSPVAAAMVAEGVDKGFALAVMGAFVALLLIGFVYEWRKGIFQWN